MKTRKIESALTHTVTGHTIKGTFGTAVYLTPGDCTLSELIKSHNGAAGWTFVQAVRDRFPHASDRIEHAVDVLA